MSRLVRAEALKVLTVRTLLWIAVGEIAFIAVAVIARVLTFDGVQDATADRSTAQFAASSMLFALLSGIFVMASESTHGTITQTLLAAPARARVVLAKVLVAAATGLALGVLAELLTIAIGAPGGVLHVGHARLVLVGTLVGAGLAGMIGVGVGTIFRAQGAAIAVSLLWLLIGESILAAAVGHGVRFFPGHAFAATAGGSRSGSDQVLGTWPAVVVAALYAAGFVAVGAALLTRRDV
jgi:ABC-type transport system involved in multi-copper enzyme maturation permease subunit